MATQLGRPATITADVRIWRDGSTWSWQTTVEGKIRASGSGFRSLLKAQRAAQHHTRFIRRDRPVGELANPNNPAFRPMSDGMETFRARWQFGVQPHNGKWLASHRTWHQRHQRWATVSQQMHATRNKAIAACDAMHTDWRRLDHHQRQVALAESLDSAAAAKGHHS